MRSTGRQFLAFLLMWSGFSTSEALAGFISTSDATTVSSAQILLPAEPEPADWLERLTSSDSAMEAPTQIPNGASFVGITAQGPATNITPVLTRLIRVESDKRPINSLEVDTPPPRVS